VYDNFLLEKFWDYLFKAKCPGEDSLEGFWSLETNQIYSFLYLIGEEKENI